MSQRDGFASGFLAGDVFGSLVGGVVGALIVSQRDQDLTLESEKVNGATDPKKVPRRRSFKEQEGESIEMARRSLEDKIAQLNSTIDEVRQQLGTVDDTISRDSTEL